MLTGHEQQPRVVAFGELVLRLHCRNNMRFLQSPGYDAYYGGSETNVCVLLSRLGIATEYISRIPQNDLAMAGVHQLKSQGVGTAHLCYGGDILGLYFTEPGNLMRPSRVIYDRSASSYATLTTGMINWNDVLEGAGYFHWSGVSAAISSTAADVCAEALQTAYEKGVIISSDFNYRSTLWQYGKHASEVMPELLQHSRIVIADLDSADVYYGIKTDRDASIEERFRQCCTALQEKLPMLQSLGMSFRRTSGLTHHYSGALMHQGQYYFTEGFQLPFITDQIGSGDAFTAGILYGLMQEKEPQSSLEFAVACGALKQSIPGDWAIISKEEVEQFVQSGTSGRIIR